MEDVTQLLKKDGKSPTKQVESVPLESVDSENEFLHKVAKYSKEIDH